MLATLATPGNELMLTCCRACCLTTGKMEKVQVQFFTLLSTHYCACFADNFSQKCLLEGNVQSNLTHSRGVCNLPDYCVENRQPYIPYSLGLARPALSPSMIYFGKK